MHGVEWTEKERGREWKGLGEREGRRERERGRGKVFVVFGDVAGCWGGGDVGDLVWGIWFDLIDEQVYMQRTLSPFSF